MAEERRTTNNFFQTLPSVFGDLYANKEWASQWELFTLVRDWPSIVGEQIAEVTRPAFFRKQTLCIHVENSAWMQHLQYLQPELLNKVNKAMEKNRITDFRWLLKPQNLTVFPEEEQVAPALPVDRQRCLDFRELIAGVGDEACRRSLFNLWYAFQSRRRTNYEPE